MRAPSMRFSAPLVGQHLYNREPQPEYNPKFAPWADSDAVDFREGRGLVAVFDFTLAASR